MCGGGRGHGVSHTAAIRSWHGPWGRPQAAGAAEGGCGSEASADITVGELIRVDEEAEHGWCLAMEVEEPALEAGVGRRRRGETNACTRDRRGRGSLDCRAGAGARPLRRARASTVKAAAVA